MEKLRFEYINLLLVDPARQARESMRSILYDQGFRRLQFGATLAEIRNRFAQEMPDMLVSESELEDGDFCEFVSALRHHQVGSNPFLPVVALTWEPTPDLVRNVVNAGVDDLLTKPISATQLVDRVRTLIKTRKPYVVTSDYIGPERRSESDRASELPRVDVPNILMAKATGQADTAKLQEEIASTLAEINVQKLERYAVQIAFLVDHIVPNLERGDVDQTTEAFLDRLLFVAEDTGRRLADTKYAHVSDLCESLIKVTGSVRGSTEGPGLREVKLLKPLSQAIRAGFELREDAVSSARKISSEIDST